MIKIEQLKARVKDGPEILKGIDLEILPGEMHAVMGPNGSGKSTLSRVIAGHPDYEVVGGSVTLQTDDGPIDLLELEPHERARAGAFLGFQYPVEIAGVSNRTFLRAAFNTVRRARGGASLDPMDFDALLQEKLDLLGIDPSFVERAANVDFSGGEKKRNEILQMALLEPRIALLDEIDSGLDVDALKAVAEGVQKLRTPDNAVVLITHYQRLLDYLLPDHVHVMSKGRFIRSGGSDLALEIEKRGYDWIINTDD
ncbi:MAG: Fe-S cluster assembly ATPase SufC [Kiritimatiellaceae bacterium]|nr:Fe-S cluster assembly ATPase SufC [Kiritimatiellaceae bacterium]